MQGIADRNYATAEQAPIASESRTEKTGRSFRYKEEVDPSTSHRASRRPSKSHPGHCSEPATPQSRAVSNEAEETDEFGRVKRSSPRPPRLEDTEDREPRLARMRQSGFKDAADRRSGRGADDYAERDMYRHDDGARRYNRRPGDRMTTNRRRYRADASFGGYCPYPSSSNNLAYYDGSAPPMPLDPYGAAAMGYYGPPPPWAMHSSSYYDPSSTGIRSYDRHRRESRRDRPARDSDSDHAYDAKRVRGEVDSPRRRDGKRSRSFARPPSTSPSQTESKPCSRRCDGSDDDASLHRFHLDKDRRGNEHREHTRTHARQRDLQSGSRFEGDQRALAAKYPVDARTQARRAASRSATDKNLLGPEALDYSGEATDLRKCSEHELRAQKLTAPAGSTRPRSLAKFGDSSCMASSSSSPASYVNRSSRVLSRSSSPNDAAHSDALKSRSDVTDHCRAGIERYDCARSKPSRSQHTDRDASRYASRNVDFERTRDEGWANGSNKIVRERAESGPEYRLGKESCSLSSQTTTLQGACDERGARDRVPHSGSDLHLSPQVLKVRPSDSMPSAIVTSVASSPPTSTGGKEGAGDVGNDLHTVGDVSEAVPRALHTEMYTRIAQVGEGTYGQVFKAKSEITGILVALKKIRMEAEKDGFPITAMREIKLLQMLRHPNIVRLHEIMTTNVRGSVYMVFEYMEHDLNGVLHHPDIRFTPSHLKSLSSQLLAGLDYLHQKSVLHRDLKGSNILLNNAGQLKLADFGLARLFAKRREGDYTNRVVTLWYRPPELLLGATRYGSKVDVWGAGCILMELFTRKAAFQGADEIHQVQTIIDRLGPMTEARWEGVESLPWWDLFKPTTPGVASEKECDESFWIKRFRSQLLGQGVPSAALDVIQCLLAYDPKRRASASQALKMDYFCKENPRPIRPADALKGLKGEWHELESKRARAKGRSAAAAAAAAATTEVGGSDKKNLLTSSREAEV